MEETPFVVSPPTNKPINKKSGNNKRGNNRNQTTPPPKKKVGVSRCRSPPFFTPQPQKTGDWLHGGKNWGLIQKTKGRKFFCLKTVMDPGEWGDLFCQGILRGPNFKGVQNFFEDTYPPGVFSQRRDFGGTNPGSRHHRVPHDLKS